MFNKNKDKQKNSSIELFYFGASQGIRTPDLSFRRRTLYPAELAAHIFACESIIAQLILICKVIFKKLEVLCFNLCNSGGQI